MSALRDFEDNLAIKPYCSQDLHGLIIRSKAKAVNYPYIQPNHAHKITWMVFDVDRGWQSALSFLDADLPEPNIIVKNLVNGNCHLFYRLEQPVYTHAAAGIKAQAYFKAIKAALTKAIGADPCYSGLIAKNPLNDQWYTTELHSGQFPLLTLADRADLQWKAESERMIDELETANSLLGRNCSLFDTLRTYSYAKVNAYRTLNMSRSYDMWLKSVESEAAAINGGFNEPLPLSEIRATAKSVAKWTWNNYNPSERINRGKMGFGETRHNFNFTAPMLPEEEIKRRQSLSAELTNKHRKENTELQIKQAIERLNANGAKVTKASVAKMTGLARTRLGRNYAYLFE
jgi:Replicase family/Primase C terminal 1 (PriCT-1)